MNKKTSPVNAAQRTARATKMVRVPAQPYVSHEPWSGFTPAERKRGSPLEICPAFACRRIKACVAAHDGLYCQRTHRLKKPSKKKPGRRKGESLEDYLNRMTILAESKGDHMARIRNLWKSGALDHRFGPYAAKGVLKVPPPKVYVEVTRQPMSRRQNPSA